MSLFPCLENDQATGCAGGVETADRERQHSPHYPETPGFKTGGTSAAAAFAVKEGAATLRARCCEMILLRGDLTADEVAALLDRSVLSVRPRVAELFAQGRIFKTGQRRTNTSGHSANVYSVDAQAKLL